MSQRRYQALVQRVGRGKSSVEINAQHGTADFYINSIQPLENEVTLMLT